MSEHHHRSGVKPNKPFKSRHATKTAQKDASKGRIVNPVNTRKSSKSNNGPQKSQSKANRRNTAKQIQANKRAAAIEAVRGKENRAPRTISIVNLSEDGNVYELLDAIGAKKQGQLWHLEPADKKSVPLRFFIANETNFSAPIISDGMILYISGSVEVSKREENYLRFLTSLAIPPDSVRLIIHSLPESTSAAASARKSILSFVNHFIPDVKRSYDIDNTYPLIRTLVDGKLHDVAWRKGRARILAEQIQPVADDQDCVDISGYIKGGVLSANRLIHVAGAGDYLIDQITVADDPYAKKAPITGMQTDEGNSSIVLSSRNESDADDLQEFNIPEEGDDLGEQTWPTDEEIALAQKENEMMMTDDSSIPPPPLADANHKHPNLDKNETSSKTRRLPKGTSQYQAAWIVDDDDKEASGSDYSSDDDDDEDEDMGGSGDDNDDDASMSAMDGAEEGEEDEEDDNDDMKSQKHVDFSEEVEKKEYDDYLEQRKRERESRDDLQFPDEIDTPLDVRASERFARFRGLKSFRTSHWDAYENLPSDYSKCFMFEDFKGMARRLEKKARMDGVMPGERVTVRIRGLSIDTLEKLSQQGPIILFNLFKHEHKYSVMNFTIQRNTECEDDIRSKDPLYVQVGPRSFQIQPIFSHHTPANNGKGSNNVHKFERYLRHGAISVATAYLPITFGKSMPAVFTKADGTLVGSGSVLSADPTRIIAKRYVLTGHPFKIHRKTATVRYMFFNSDDVNYFKPIELYTKKGKVGHIKESLGTHGYFKAGFNAPMDQMDTVCLNLYKRCYPKWGQGSAPLPSNITNGQVSKDVQMEE